MSTAVLSAVGVAQAAPVPFTTETPLTVPADTCTIRFVLAGGSGADVGGQVGGAGDKLTLDWVVYPGEQYLADTVTYAGGAGGTGGGAGGEGVGLVMDGELIMVAAGGGGAGSLADGGAAGGVGGSLPDLDEADGLYTWGGDPGGWSLPGNGGLSGPDVVGGFDGGAGVDSVGGDAGGPGAGGGGGGVFGGGAGASDGTDGAGGGGGYSEGGEPA